MFSVIFAFLLILNYPRMAIHNDQLTIWNPSPNLERTLRKEMESASQGGQQSATQIQGHLSQQPQTHPTPVSYTHLTLPTIYSV